jgi:hypothetical protein
MQNPIVLEWTWPLSALSGVPSVVVGRTGAVPPPIGRLAHGE